MATFELIRHGGGRGLNRYVVKSEGLFIGRSPEADVVLSGRAVSRQHARVWIDGDVLGVEDLGSRNGIRVNGQKVKRGRLKSGDHLMVGEVVLEVALSEGKPSSSTVISFEVASTLTQKFVGEEISPRFRLLHDASQLLGTVFDIDILMDKILGLVFDVLPARRGYVLTCLGESKHPEVRAEHLLEGEPSEPSFSHTIVNSVIQEREAVLTPNATEDSRFDGAKSIIGYGIRAALCAPLCGQHGKVIGAIYVDSGCVEAVFTEGDLQMLTVLAQIVGVAVENAQLYQEHVEQERLAALGQAMAGVGHCVRNLVTGIRGGSEFLEKALETGDLKYLTIGWPTVRGALDRLDAIVLNMLTFARDPRPQREPRQINPLVEEVFALVKPRAEKLKVELEFVPGEVGEVPIDYNQIFRVVLNLVTNAIDACQRRGGKVTVVTVDVERWCSIEVRDTGEGIPDDVKPRLFEAFVSTKGSSGIGLGLACTMKIVEAHGGDIDVESERGKGATFIVHLPRDI